MAEMTSVERAVKAAFQRGDDINLYRHPIRFECDISKGTHPLGLDRRPAWSISSACVTLSVRC